MRFKAFMEKSSLMALHQRYQLIFQPLQKDLRSLGLNLQDSLVLLATFFENSKSVFPSDLQATLLIPKDQISQSLGRLEEKNLIRRQLSVHDKRRRHIEITSLGKKISSQLVSRFDKHEDQLEALSVESLNISTEVLLQNRNK